MGDEEDVGLGVLLGLAGIFAGELAGLYDVVCWFLSGQNLV